MLIMANNKNTVVVDGALPRVEEQEEEDASSITSTVPVTNDGSCCAAMDVVVADDDITVSSSSSCESSSSSNSKTQIRRKTVHFDASQNQIHIDTRLYEFWTYKNDVWYNALDYQHFQRTTSHIASRIAHCSADYNNSHDDPFARTYYQVLLRTYQACCQASANMAVVAVNTNSSSSSDDQDVMMMDDDSTNQNDSNQCHKNNSNFVLFDNAAEQAQALQWIHAACANGALLGVAEKHAIYEIVLDRLHRRMELVSDILEIQEAAAYYSDRITRRHDEQATTDNANDHGPCHQAAAAVAERMRMASCEKSRPSRLFAQVLAQAVL
jgi:hypothetical protein